MLSRTEIGVVMKETADKPLTGLVVTKSPAHIGFIYRASHGFTSLQLFNLSCSFHGSLQTGNRQTEPET